MYGGGSLTLLLIPLSPRAAAAADPASAALHKGCSRHCALHCLAFVLYSHRLAEVCNMTELWAAVLLTELSQSAEIARAQHGKLRGESHIPDLDARYSGAVPSFSQIAGLCLLGKSAACLRNGHRADLAHLGQKQACQTRALLRCTHCEQHRHPLHNGCGDSKLNLFVQFVKRCPVLLVDNQQAVVRERDIRNGYPSTQASRRLSIVALLVFSAQNVDHIHRSPDSTGSTRCSLPLPEGMIIKEPAFGL